MKHTIVRSQGELDVISADECVWLEIAFGTPAQPAKLEQTLRSPIILAPNCCLSVFGSNKVRFAKGGSTVYAHNDCTVVASNATVSASGNVYVSAKGNSNVVLTGESYADLWDESHCIAKDETAVDAHDNSTVEARDASAISLWDSSVAVVKSYAVDIEVERGMHPQSVLYQFESEENEKIA